MPLQIPLPGGSGAAPSGAAQFRDDWPGLWLRGDEALALARELRAAIAALRHQRATVLTHHMEQVADLIDRDVRVD
jgi:hypothetical protein